MLQQDIDNIVFGSDTNECKIQSIRLLMLKFGVKNFTDLDDTLSINQNCLYSKVRYLQRFSDKIGFFDMILEDFELNADFLKLAQETHLSSFCIISRNNHEFVSYFIAKTKTLFASHNITLLAGIGTQHNFTFDSFDKLRMIPEKSVIISDIFEYKSLHLDSRFFCIEEYSFWKELSKKFIKSMHFGYFSITFFLGKIFR